MKQCVNEEMDSRLNIEEADDMELYMEVSTLLLHKTFYRKTDCSADLVVNQVYLCLTRSYLQLMSRGAFFLTLSPPPLISRRAVCRMKWIVKSDTLVFLSF